MNKIQLLQMFKQNLLAFLDTMVEQFPEENDFRIFKVLVNDIPVEESLKYFSQVILPHADKVLKKDDTFFVNECSNILSGFNVNSQKTDHFKKIWLSPRLDAEDRENLWKWFKLFLNIAQQYKKLSS